MLLQGDMNACGKSSFISSPTEAKSYRLQFLTCEKFTEFYVRNHKLLCMNELLFRITAYI